MAYNLLILLFISFLFIVLTIMLCFLIIGILFNLYYHFPIFSNPIKNYLNSRVFKRQAKMDYHGSRGYNHYLIAKEALQNIQYKKKDNESQIRSLRKDIEKRERTIKIKIQNDFFRHAFRHRFQKEVYGIGPSSMEKIKSHIYNGNIDSLKRCYSISGIGYQKQDTINNWIEKIKREGNRINLQEYDPESYRLLQNFKTEVEVDTSKLRSEIDELSLLKDVCKEYIDNFSNIKLRNLMLTMMNIETGKNTKIMHIGMYPPWKEEPIWFKKIIKYYGDE